MRELNKDIPAKSDNLNQYVVITQKRWHTGKLVLFTNSNSHSGFHWVSSWWPWVTLNGLVSFVMYYFIQYRSFRSQLHKIHRAPAVSNRNVAEGLFLSMCGLWGTMHAIPDVTELLVYWKCCVTTSDCEQFL